MSSSTLEIARGDSRVANVVVGAAAATPDLPPNTLRLRIDRFGVTANNITYVSFAGKPYDYGLFFPSSNPAESIIMPVWGIATVIVSTHPAVAVGERLYGYFPTASHVDISVSSVSASTINVSRPQLPADRAAYNQYARLATDPFYDEVKTDAMVIFRPLWLTSFLLQDFLAENSSFSAESIVITSASAKTAFCLAHLLKVQNDTIESEGDGSKRSKRIIGLTSARNLDFVKRLGVYTEVITYDHAASVLRSTTAVIVDVAGDASLISKIVTPAPDNVKQIVVVGNSHYDPSIDVSKTSRLPAAVAKRRNVFFAPGWSQKRIREIGSREFMRRTVAGWGLLMDIVDSWMTFVEMKGIQGARDAYLKCLQGSVPADQAYVISFTDNVAPSKL